MSYIFSAGLSEMPARVEGDRLADEAEHEVALRPLCRLVTEDDQTRPVRARAPDGRERAHAELVDLVRDRAPRRSRFGPASSARPCGEVLGRQLVRRRVGEVAGPVDPLARRARRGSRRRATPLSVAGVEHELARSPCAASPASSSARGCRSRASLPRRRRAPARPATAAASRRAASRACRRCRRVAQRRPRRRSAARRRRPRRACRPRRRRRAVRSSSPSVWRSDGLAELAVAARRRRRVAAAGRRAARRGLGALRQSSRPRRGGRRACPPRPARQSDFDRDLVHVARA